MHCIKHNAERENEEQAAQSSFEAIAMEAGVIKWRLQN
jgi:hypothetical protein